MQSQQHVRKEFIARAKMLAHVMTSSTNIKVTISGDTPFCSFGHINLPAGDYTDPKFIKMIQGWIDHELGHEDETSVTHCRLSKDNPVLANVFNIVEDVRMETSRGVKFRGAKTNLMELAKLAIEREYFQAPTGNDLGNLIFGLILYRGRTKVIGQHCLDDFAHQAESLLISQTTPSFAEGLCQLIDKIVTLTDSKGSLNLSKEIIEYIKDEDDNQQPDQSQDDQDQSDENQDNSDETSDSPQSDDSTDNSDDSTEQETQANSDDASDEQAPQDQADSSDDQNGSTSQETEEGDNSDENEESESDNTGAQSDPSSSQSTLRLILTAMEDCELEDYHDVIAKMIEQDVSDQPISNPTPVCDFVENADFYHHDSNYLDIPMAKTTSANVFQALHKVLFDIQADLPVNRVRGKRINSNKFSGIPAGNTKVFTSRVEQEVRKAAVSLVIDASPSMGEERMKSANTCALSFAFALERLNVPFEVVYYGSFDEKNGVNTMYKPKTFDSKLKREKFAVFRGNWSTPTGEAMQLALYSLAMRSEDNKLMLLITDGEPDHMERVEESHEIAKAFGVRVVPFGLCTSVVRGFEKDEFVSISDPSQLSVTVRQAIKQKLIA